MTESSRSSVADRPQRSVAGGPPLGSPPAPARRPNRRRRRRARRLQRRWWFGRHPVASGALLVLVLLTPVWYSLGSALTNPTFGVSVSGRFAEWARDHGGGGIVVWAENTWYSHHPPKVGGAPSAASLNAKGADKSSGTTHVAKSTVLPAPKAIQPFAAPALRGEGTWAPVGRLVHGVPAVYEAFLRPDAVHTSYVAGVAWMDTKLLKASLYSGSYIPGGGPWPLTAPVQPGAARSLVAAFNAGFRTQDSQGGYYTDHQTVAPLRAGSASFVIYKNGSATVGQWGRDVRMTPQVASVRQNLVLLVDGGKPAPTLNANDTTKWGLTLGNQVYVWRSGVGVTANGALVYVAGPALNITDLANLLARAGAVRAMELDINTDWVNFATFKPAGNGLASTANGTDLLSNMSASPARYFDSAWSRDFFTMSARGG